jgi:molybdopterin converting factor subunit 1
MRAMHVRVLYFAALRDISGVDEQQIEIAEGSRAADLWERLREEYPELATREMTPMIAVNESYVRPDTPLSDGDEVAFIPPVSVG